MMHTVAQTPYFHKFFVSIAVVFDSPPWGLWLAMVESGRCILWPLVFLRLGKENKLFFSLLHIRVDHNIPTQNLLAREDNLVNIYVFPTFCPHQPLFPLRPLKKVSPSSLLKRILLLLATTTISFFSSALTYRLMLACSFFSSATPTIL